MKFNPFLITGYKSSEYFCDREIESEKLKDAIDNQRNITLISSRRMGKTGLIMHVFDQVSSDSSKVPIYFDIMGTTGFDEFVKVFCNAVLQAMSKTEQAWKKERYLVNGKYLIVKKTERYRQADRDVIEMEIYARDNLSREDLDAFKAEIRNNSSRKLVIRAKVTYIL